MSNSGSDGRRPRGGLAFFGRVVASVSHEMNNVITIVSEVAGLLEDMTVLAEAGSPIDPVRLKTQCARIDRQVSRAKAILKALNFFSHSVDRETEETDLGMAVANIVFLAGRLAETRGAQLAHDGSGRDLLVRCSRFGLERLVLQMIDAVVDSATQAGTVSVTVAVRGESAVLEVACDASLAEGKLRERLSDSELLAAELGGTLEVAHGADARTSLAVVLPVIGGKVAKGG